MRAAPSAQELNGYCCKLAQSIGQFRSHPSDDPVLARVQPATEPRQLVDILFSPAGNISDHIEFTTKMAEVKVALLACLEGADPRAFDFHTPRQWVTTGALCQFMKYLHEEKASWWEEWCKSPGEARARYPRISSNKATCGCQSMGTSSAHV